MTMPIFTWTIQTNKKNSFITDFDFHESYFFFNISFDS